MRKSLMKRSLRLLRFALPCWLWRSVRRRRRVSGSSRSRFRAPPLLRRNPSPPDHSVRRSAAGCTGRPPDPPAMLPAHCRIAAVLAPSLGLAHRNGESGCQPNGTGNLKLSATEAGPGLSHMLRPNAAGAREAKRCSKATRRPQRIPATRTRKLRAHPSHSDIPKKLIDYAYRAVHEMTVQSKAIITAFYGRGPRLSLLERVAPPEDVKPSWKRNATRKISTPFSPEPPRTTGHTSAPGTLNLAVKLQS